MASAVIIAAPNNLKKSFHDSFTSIGPSKMFQWSLFVMADLFCTLLRECLPRLLH